MYYALRVESGNHSLKVSKTDLLRYVETQFDAVDLNHDGSLDIDDLQRFLRILSHPAIERSRA
jgi:Ca2+-binding EF-hand superfamily protein